MDRIRRSTVQDRVEQMVELQAVVAWISHTVHSHDQPTSWAVQNEPQDIRNHRLSALPSNALR